MRVKMKSLRVLGKGAPLHLFQQASYGQMFRL
jgi:hypothetical protein